MLTTSTCCEAMHEFVWSLRNSLASWKAYQMYSVNQVQIEMNSHRVMCSKCLCPSKNWFYCELVPEVCSLACVRHSAFFFNFQPLHVKAGRLHNRICITIRWEILPLTFSLISRVFSISIHKLSWTIMRWSFRRQEWENKAKCQGKEWLIDPGGIRIETNVDGVTKSCQSSR